MRPRVRQSTHTQGTCLPTLLLSHATRQFSSRALCFPQLIALATFEMTSAPGSNTSGMRLANRNTVRPCRKEFKGEEAESVVPGVNDVSRTGKCRAGRKGSQSAVAGWGSEGARASFTPFPPMLTAASTMNGWPPCTAGGAGWRNAAAGT